MKCSDCAYENGPSDLACNMCGAVLRRVRVAAGSAAALGPARPRLEEVHAAEWRAAEADREEKHRMLRRRRLKSHAVTGAITFFVLITMFGLPTSLLPGEILINLILSTAVGMPVGFLISRYGGGMGRGALISGGALVLIVVVRVLWAGSFGVGTVPWLIVFFALGAIPGIFIGYHVTLDDS